MTTREIFNKVKTALLKQNVQCKDVNGNCVHINKNGLRCAIGHIIPNEIFDRKFNHSTLHELLIYPQFQVILPTDIDSDSGFYFLRDLQTIHDGYQPNDWAQELNNFCIKWHLDS